MKTNFWKFFLKLLVRESFFKNFSLEQIFSLRKIFQNFKFKKNLPKFSI